MRLTMRKSGERMATFAIKFHASEALIDWTAKRLGCSRTRALKAIQDAYDAAIGNSLMMRAIVFDPEGGDEDMVKILHDDEVDDLDKDNVWGGGL